MLVELVIVACLAQDPTRCETVREPFNQEMELPQCVFVSQFRAAQWAGEHPKWTIRKFTCEAPQA